MDYKTCCFIGHRKIEMNNELFQNLRDSIENLIINCNVINFLFGSRSEFNELCHIIVSDLKKNYSNIKRIMYTCTNESCILKDKKFKFEKIFFEISKQNINLLEFEEEFEYKNKYTAGKASYIERNKEMIDNSDYCIFYFKEGYIPKHKANRTCNVLKNKLNSGTKIAYEYAIKKQKEIINFYK